MFDHHLSGKSDLPKESIRLLILLKNTGVHRYIVTTKILCDHTEHLYELEKEHQRIYDEIVNDEIDTTDEISVAIYELFIDNLQKEFENCKDVF
jgi:hypothetical protein